MVKINGKETEYELATLSIMYDNSINPTGLGSVGIILLLNSNTKIYIGLKYDVISISTNKNICSSINVEKRFRETYKESMYGTKDYSIYDVKEEDLIKIYLNNYLIELDVRAFIKSVYIVNKDNYFNLAKNKVFRENCYGCVMHYYSSYNKQNLRDIGLLSYTNKQDLVINQIIVDKNKIDDEFYYSIWFLKQSLSNETVKVNKPIVTYECINTGNDKLTYINYFNKLNKASGGDKVDILYDNILGTSSIEKSALLKIKSSDTINNTNDVWVTDGVVDVPGIRDSFIQVNYGLKEARKGYFNLEKGDSFKNIGYESNDGIFGDNFIINKVNKNNCELFIKDYNFPLIEIKSDSEAIHHFKPNCDFENKAKLYIYFKHKDNPLGARKSLVEFIKNNHCLCEYVTQEAVDKFLNTIDVSLTVPMLSKKKKLTTFNDVKNSIIFVINPFYNKSFFKIIEKEEDIVINENELYITDINYNKYGFSYDKFFWNNVPKKFRRNEYKKDFFKNIKFKDLSKTCDYTKLLADTKDISYLYECSVNIEFLTASSLLDQKLNKVLSDFYHNRYGVYNEFASLYVVDIEEFKRTPNSEMLIGKKQGVVLL
jgi:hypothetical protein